MLMNLAVAVIVALVVYFVATTLIGHALIVGLVCLLIFLAIAFNGFAYPGRRVP